MSCQPVPNVILSGVTWNYKSHITAPSQMRAVDTLPNSIWNIICMNLTVHHLIDNV